MGRACRRTQGKQQNFTKKPLIKDRLTRSIISGWLYENGQGVPKDLAKAAELYQKAADQGSADAQNNLGVLYANGQGVPKDLRKAAELYQKAADQGYANAQNNLGVLYANGAGRAEGPRESSRTLPKSG